MNGDGFEMHTEYTQNTNTHHHLKRKVIRLDFGHILTSNYANYAKMRQNGNKYGRGILKLGFNKFGDKTGTNMVNEQLF